MSLNCVLCAVAVISKLYTSLLVESIPSCCSCINQQFQALLRDSQRKQEALQLSPTRLLQVWNPSAYVCWEAT